MSYRGVIRMLNKVSRLLLKQARSLGNEEYTYVGVTGSNTCLSDFRYLISSTRDSLFRNTFVHKATGVFTNRFRFSTKSSREPLLFVSTIIKHCLFFHVVIYLSFLLFLFACILFPLITSIAHMFKLILASL